jgi:hypothetical protein
LVSQLPAQPPTPYEEAAASSTTVISSAGFEEGQDGHLVRNNFEARKVVHDSRTKSRSYSNLNAKMDENLSGEQAPDTL